MFTKALAATWFLSSFPCDLCICKCNPVAGHTFFPSHNPLADRGRKWRVCVANNGLLDYNVQRTAPTASPGFNSRYKSPTCCILSEVMTSGGRFHRSFVIYLHIRWRIFECQEHVPVPSAIWIAGPNLNKEITKNSLKLDHLVS